MTLAAPAHALFLACGCPCSVAYIGESAKALGVLYGPAILRRDTSPQPPFGARLRPVEGPALTAAVRQLQAAPGRRFTCRSAHHLAGE